MSLARGPLMPASDTDSPPRGAYEQNHAFTSLVVLPSGTRLEQRGARAWGLKRAIDIVLAGLALLVLAPVWGLIALAILIDSGRPVMFRQQRIGKYGRPFVMWKF